VEEVGVIQFVQKSLFLFFLADMQRVSSLLKSSGQIHLTRLIDSIPHSVPRLPFSRFFHSSLVLTAGHSKWHNIMHRKKRQDTKRMVAFNKLSKEITTAVRVGGSDVGSNVKLVAALEKAKLYNFPKENIDAILQKVSSSENFEEVLYEGYGPNGVAILVEALTDSKNRTAQSLRFLFSKHGGSLAPNSVLWMFEHKGIIIFDGKNHSEEELLEILIENGAEDAQFGIGEKQNLVEAKCAKNDFIRLKKSIENKQFPIDSADLVYVTAGENTVLIAEMDEQLQTLIDALDEHPDVQNVYHNLELRNT